MNRKYLNPVNVSQSFALWFRTGRTDVLMAWTTVPPHVVGRAGYALGRAVTEFRERIR